MPWGGLRCQKRSERSTEAFLMYDMQTKPRTRAGLSVGQGSD